MTARGLVILDLDGTLLQAHLITIPAVQQACAVYGVSPPPPDRIEATFGIPVAEYEAWLEGYAPGHGHELVEAANRIELRLIREAGALYPGTHDALDALRAAGCTLACCSNGSEAYVHEALDAHRLRPHFAAVCCIGEGHMHKTAMVADLLRRLSPRPALVAGDRASDVGAARANGIGAVAIAYGYGTPSELADADAAVERVDDLPAVCVELLDRLGATQGGV